jgi:hypothetical protein
MATKKGTMINIELYISVSSEVAVRSASSSVLLFNFFDNNQMPSIGPLPAQIVTWMLVPTFLSSLMISQR